MGWGWVESCAVVMGARICLCWFPDLLRQPSSLARCGSLRVKTVVLRIEKSARKCSVLTCAQV